MANSYRIDYDTKAIRAAASKLKNCASNLSNGTRPKIQKIQSELSSNLEGNAAKALEARVSEMSADVNVLVNSMNGLSAALNKYAAELERTAQQLRGTMS